MADKSANCGGVAARSRAPPGQPVLMHEAQKRKREAEHQDEHQEPPRALRSPEAAPPLNFKYEETAPGTRKRRGKRKQPSLDYSTQEYAAQRDRAYAEEREHASLVAEALNIQGAVWMYEGTTTLPDTGAWWIHRVPPRTRAQAVPFIFVSAALLKVAPVSDVVYFIRTSQLCFAAGHVAVGALDTQTFHDVELRINSLSPIPSISPNPTNPRVTWSLGKDSKTTLPGPVGMKTTEGGEQGIDISHIFSPMHIAPLPFRKGGDLIQSVALLVGSHECYPLSSTAISLAQRPDADTCRALVRLTGMCPITWTGTRWEPLLPVSYLVFGLDELDSEATIVDLLGDSRLHHCTCPFFTHSLCFPNLPSALRLTVEGPIEELLRNPKIKRCPSKIEIEEHAKNSQEAQKVRATERARAHNRGIE